MFCRSCGAKADPEARFCGDCGTGLLVEPESEHEAENRWPGEGAGVVTVAAPAAAPITVPVMTVEPPTLVSSSSGERRGWLLPAAVAAGLVVAGGVVAGFLVLSGGSSGPSFTERVSAVVAPVATADRRLDARLQSAETSRDLAGVSKAAASVVERVTRAQGALAVVDAKTKDAPMKTLVSQALDANLAYATKVHAATRQLSAVRAAASATASQQTAQAYQAVAAAAPTVTVPSTGVFLSVGQLGLLAAQQEKAAEAKRQQRAAKASALNVIRTYVRSIDSLLRNSADTRGNLGTLIDDIRSEAIDGSQATAQIASIINQRQDLQNQVSAVPAPTSFRAAADQLRDSLKSALDDDYAIQSWVNAWYMDDVYAFERAYARHETATAQASAAKASFLDTYNRLRARYLHLAPIDVAY